MLAIGPRFAGSNSTKDDGFSMAIKIHSMTSIRGQEKLVVPHKILQHVKDPTV
jgi:hypothetical protein